MIKSVALSAMTLFARDPEALAKWYGTRLGIQTAYNRVDRSYYGALNDDDRGKVMYLRIAPARDQGMPRTDALRLDCYERDFDYFIRSLEQAGVTLERILQDDYARMAQLIDPEGNPLEIWAELH